MAGKTTLMVPIRIDALFVETDGLEFGSPFADFSQLPYKLSNGNKQNGDTPNLAEATVVQSGVLSFPKGLHLHWALPDALTTGYHRDESTVFPAVPNRWLVRRLDQAGTLQKSMIVESDFLHPCDNNGQPQPPETVRGNCVVATDHVSHETSATVRSRFPLPGTHAFIDGLVNTIAGQRISEPARQQFEVQIFRLPANRDWLR